MFVPRKSQRRSSTRNETHGPVALPGGRKGSERRCILLFLHHRRVCE